MKKKNVKYIFSIFLVFAVGLTGLTGLIQARLDLHGFVPHRYFAYTTLTLAAIHVVFNFRTIVRHLKNMFRRK